jgi:hypothetical protein
MSYASSRVAFLGALATLAVGSGCGGNSSSSPDAPYEPDGAVGEETSPVSEAGPSFGEAGGEAMGTASVAGIVTDGLGVPVLGAKIEASGLSVFSDAQGKFTLAGLPVGTLTFTVSQSWFQPLEQSVAVTGAGTAYNPVLTEMPLVVSTADRALVDAYNATFDWTQQKLSMAIAPVPTRCAFDNAVYLHNPALYRDTSTQAPVTPAPQPQIVAGVASGFTFPVLTGANKGQEALDLATIADTIAGAPLGPVEPASYMVWKSMVNWLTEWSASKSITVKVAGLAVQQQGWGSNAIRPQDIEKVFIDPATGRLWVKVVFESFVQLGPGIADDDGDGRKEIYAALGDTHYTAEIRDALLATYMTVTFNTHGLSKQLSNSLNELYSTTAAKVEGYIGQPFTVPSVGTITYPFVVLRHAGGQENVILVAPGP